MHSQLELDGEWLGRLSGAIHRQVYLKDLVGLFQDVAGWHALVSDHNRLIYEVYLKEPEQADEAKLAYGTTILYPGKVGAEYVFTRGHRHAQSDRTEVYQVLQGVGYLLLVGDDGVSETIHLEPGTVAYIAGGKAHRVVNTGTTPLVWFAVYPSDAGHDYQWVTQQGFGRRLLEVGGQPAWIDA